MANFMTPAQAARIIGCTPAYVRSLIRSGNLPAKWVQNEVHENSYYLISEEEVIRIKDVPHRISRGRKAK